MNKLFCYLKFTRVLFILVFTHAVFAQNSAVSGIKYIQKLIETDSLQKAEVELDKQIDYFKQQKKYDTLAYYIYNVGKIELLKNKITSFPKTFDLYRNIETHTYNSKALYKVNIDLSLLFGERNLAVKAYTYAVKANEIAKKTIDKKLIVESAYYMAMFGLRQGNFNLLQQHTNEALKIIEDNPNNEFSIASKVYGYMGSLMYFTSKPDSSEYYFKKALNKVSRLEDNPENKYYTPATIRGNYILLKQSQGKFSEAMPLAIESIQLFNQFLKTTTNHPLRQNVLRNLAIAYRNIGSLYNDVGEKAKAENFANMGYQHAKKYFLPSSTDYYYATLMMAEATLYNKNYDTALKYLKEAEESLSDVDTKNFALNVSLYSIFGDLFYYTSEFEKAKYYYELANTYHKKLLFGEYTRDRIYMLANLASTYAQLNEKEKAISTVENAYKYLLKNDDKEKLLTNVTLYTLASISMTLGEYEECKKWCKKSLEIYDNNNSLNKYDIASFEDNKAGIILLQTKAEYYLLKNKDIAMLLSFQKRIKEAVQILEQRKSIIFTDSDINTFLASNKNVFDFAKKLNLELYELTNEDKYLSNVLSLHESIIYTRIRARLDLKENITFSNVSKEVLSRETRLKKKLNKNITNENLNSFIQDTGHWNSFLDSLEQGYPKYYKMRYASIEESLEDLQNNIPKNTTLVRYLFIENNLYALVVNKKQKEIFKLNFEAVKDDLYLEENQFEVQKINVKLLNLYQNLWQPFETKVTTENIIIFPDRELFNLNFEILTPNKINSFKELATNSLLAKHTISYNYSLLLLDKNKKTIDYSNNFIAFAPEFTDKMKENYKIAITDSISLDKTYLTLLPQPFSVDLVKETTKLFNGSSFLNERSTKQIFTNNAKEHKIIHIGTHAESNNVFPELSRLIFAKNTEDEDNSLYTYEIYNQNLSSNLAILTACETGKPTYQSGEGMISLAHAFNYAGSESILTSLWKIDEQSSSQIINFFYKNLSKGLSKDKALRQAKLDYISTAEGRTISPQYWAGLVLIGNASPIDISTSNPWFYWSLILITLSLVLLFFIRKRIKN
jgi:CHAT domain-containing protein/tetratricopeptide (TPR) repeat protein